MGLAGLGIDVAEASQKEVFVGPSWPHVFGAGSKK
jgi:hypothetical protein